MVNQSKAGKYVDVLAIVDLEDPNKDLHPEAAYPKGWNVKGCIDAEVLKDATLSERMECERMQHCLDFLQEFPRLSPHVSKIRDTIIQKRSEHATKPIQDPEQAIADQAFVNCVQYLSDLVWFDTLSPNKTTIVKDQLLIAQERCL